MTTLYRFYDSDGELLYIGITDPGLDRFKQHSSSKPWWLDTHSARLNHYDSRDYAKKLEKRAIELLKPLHNIVHNKDSKYLRYSDYIFDPSDLWEGYSEWKPKTGFALCRDCGERILVRRVFTILRNREVVCGKCWWIWDEQSAMWCNTCNLLHSENCTNPKHRSILDDPRQDHVYSGTYI